MSSSRRASGVILHPTSLPGPHGIGDLGSGAEAWVDFLHGARQQLWQVLPLGPTGFGDSPYQCFSALAGNPYLVSPDALAEHGLLAREDISAPPGFPAEYVDYGSVIRHKVGLLERAFAAFRAGAGASLRPEFEAFCVEQAHWLDDFALFMALKDAYGGAMWNTWERELAARQPKALQEARGRLADQIESHRFRQFLFFRQWLRVKARANQAGIRIIGDIPIFVAYDSADVWGHPELFYLDRRGQPTIVAGVPPDYFSATGQLWGNPLYRWEAHARTGYQWWIARFRAVLALVDIVRIDHFRGFEAYWAIPHGNDTAQVGEWQPGPGAAFFSAIRAAIGDLPIIAEDLGFITPEVLALRDQFRLPGLKVLQFAFGAEPHDAFLPHNYGRNCVVYTGTHDNDTTLGWYSNTSTEAERDFCRRYLGVDGHDIAWDLMRAAWASVADTAMTPLQDVLSLGSEARLNYPGRPSGNWRWRFCAEALTPALQARLRELTELYARGATQVDVGASG